ncbi:MAG: hypothetical protein CL816_02545 [Coxiellaceae bacterium]|nr:hypothetical protein [Coxiellaceae bacterium]
MEKIELLFMRKPDSDTRLAIAILCILSMAAWLFYHSSQSSIMGNEGNCLTNGSMSIIDQNKQRAPWCHNNHTSPYRFNVRIQASSIRY